LVHLFRTDARETRPSKKNNSNKIGIDVEQQAGRQARGRTRSLMSDD
jgi:hypothetical protein